MPHREDEPSENPYESPHAKADPQRPIDARVHWAVAVLAVAVAAPIAFGAVCLPTAIVTGVTFYAMGPDFAENVPEIMVYVVSYGLGGLAAWFVGRKIWKWLRGVREEPS